MKLFFDIEVNDITIDSDSETGRVDGVWVDNINYADRTVEELVIAMIGGHDAWAELISRKTDQEIEGRQQDRSEDQYGVPI
jgi:hypothetical protein